MHHTPHAPQPFAAPVLYTPDGTPYYATPTPVTAPPAHYHPAAALPVPAQHAAPAPYHPAKLPQAPAVPARDPWPARLVAGGVGIGGAGIGIGFLAQALAAATTALGFVTAGLAVVWLLKTTHGGGGRGGQGAVNVSVNVTNRNR
ncbi:hypothetical protein [Kitasatospora sp. NPDC056181]|uniref:hypothetical protein n=1 Tax=Kitasatospora sp. NPDC056181 TaxID=3345737 RepID=UPI0035DDBCD5